MYDLFFYMSTIVDIGLTCAIFYAVFFRGQRGISLNAQILHGSAHMLRTVHFLVNIRAYWALGTLSFVGELLMQAFYVVSSGLIVYTLYKRNQQTQHNTSYTSANPDFVEWYYLFVPAVVVGAMFNISLISMPWQMCQMIAFWVDAVADLPQIYMIYSYSKSQKGRVDNFVADYVFLLSASRMGFFLSYLIYGHISYGLLQFLEWQVIVMQLLRLAVFADFVYKYIRYRFYGEKEAFLADPLDSVL